MIKYIALVLGVVSVSFISILAIGLPMSYLASADISGEQIDVWWPTDGAHVAGTQPLKAVLAGQAVDSYDMYWQVDGGNLVAMPSNATDYAHKEADVDFSNWNWNGAGPYTINFVAKRDGSIVGQHSIQIYMNGTTISADPAPATAVTADPSSTSTLAIAPITATIVSTNVLSPAPTPAVPQTKIWWPTDGAQVAGLQIFKAAVGDRIPGTYQMYWQVDNGQLNEMNDSYSGSPHKEADVDLSTWHWNDSGTYTITFVAKAAENNLGSQSVTIHVTSGATTPIPQTTATVNEPVSVSTPQPSPVIQSTAAIGGMKLYVDPNSRAAAQARDWRSSRPSDAAAMDTLASQPTATWLGGWSGDVRSVVQSLVSAAQGSGATPVMVAYNIPGRDCGSYSAGGAAANDYSSWIGAIAAGIGDAPAIVILEPDSLAQISCLSSDDQQARLQLLSQAVSMLKSHSNTRVYLDAGHSGWVDADTMAGRLKVAGIDRADGFALNVSNFGDTSGEVSYGSQLSQMLGSKHFVVDTSRNGLGSNGEWCNPAGRAIGTKPTMNTGNGLVDAYLWLKTPGESDGTCNGGPSAGTWWPDYALQLVKNAQ